MTPVPPRERGVRRLFARLGLLAILVPVAGGLSTADGSDAAPVSAGYPEIIASADCSGLVTFTAAAWTPRHFDPQDHDQQRARTNDRLEIDYTSDGRTWRTLPWREAYHFGSDNDFSFTGEFALPEPLPRSVTVRARAQAPWADGTGPGGRRVTTVASPDGCPGGGSATIASVDCADGTARATPQVENGCGERAPAASVTVDCEVGAQVVLDNSASTRPVAFDVHGPDGLHEQVTVRAGRTAIRSYALPEEVRATYRVEAPGMSPMVRTVRLDCGSRGPVVDVTSDCDSVVLMLGNEGTGRADFTVTLPDGSEEQRTVQAGRGPAEITYLPADESGTIMVSAPGMQDVVVPAPEGCGPAPARSHQTGQTTPLAETGASVLPLLGVAAALVALGGLTLVLARRRRSGRHTRR